MTRILVSAAFVATLVLAGNRMVVAQLSPLPSLDGVGVGILREDAVLVPVAIFDKSRWITPWSTETAELPDGATPPSLGNVPRTWWGDRPAMLEWELLDGAGARRRVRVNAVTAFKNHCTGGTGLATNFSARVDLEPNTFPLPYAGIVATMPNLLMPVGRVAPGASAFRVIERALPGLLARLEPALWEGVDGDYRPRLTGTLPRPQLGNVYVSNLPDGRQLFHFNGRRELPHNVSDKPLEAVTKINGWAFSNGGTAPLVLGETSVSQSDFDGKGGDDQLTPLAALTVGKRVFWIGNTSGYEWETYFVLEVSNGKPGTLVSSEAGGC